MASRRTAVRPPRSVYLVSWGLRPVSSALYRRRGHAENRLRREEARGFPAHLWAAHDIDWEDISESVSDPSLRDAAQRRRSWTDDGGRLRTIIASDPRLIDRVIDSPRLSTALARVEALAGRLSTLRATPRKRR